jgi:hypothetical protein
MNLTKFIAVMLLMGALTSCSQDALNTNEWEIKDTTCPCEKPEFLENIKGEVLLFDPNSLDTETFALPPEVIQISRNEDNTVNAFIKGKYINVDLEPQTGIISNFPSNIEKNIKIPPEGIMVYYEGKAYKWCEESGYIARNSGFTYLVTLTKFEIKKS